MGSPGEMLRVNHIVKVTRVVYWPEKSPMHMQLFDPNGAPHEDAKGCIRMIYRGGERAVYANKGEKGKIVAIFRDGLPNRKIPFAKVRMKDGEVKDISLGLLKRTHS